MSLDKLAALAVLLFNAGPTACSTTIYLSLLSLNLWEYLFYYLMFSSGLWVDCWHILPTDVDTVIQNDIWDQISL